MSFKKGDIVVLNSGSPSMTIEKIYTTSGGDNKVDCAWFVDKEVKTHSFSAEALKLYHSD